MEGETTPLLPKKDSARTKEQEINDIERELETLSRREIAAKIFELKKDAVTDGLTGLLTQRAFLKEAETYFRHAAREKEPFACGFLDMRKFKGLNDKYGHEVGNVVLEKTARALRKATRDSDIIGRYGGDEFTILFVDCRSEEI